MHMTATLTKWYEEHGRHEIFAGGKKVNVPSKEQQEYLRLREEIVTNEVQHDLDKLGIAKTAREEKTRARNAKLAAAQKNAQGADATERVETKVERGAKKNDPAYDARMAQLYREVVLKEKPATSNDAGFIPLGAIAGAKANGNGHSHGNGHHGNGHNGLHGIQPAKQTQTEDIAEPVAGD
jgi:7,8-dihydro-6-hydroxymethylpterin dimethyltransferase